MLFDDPALDRIILHPYLYYKAPAGGETMLLMVKAEHLVKEIVQCTCNLQNYPPNCLEFSVGRLPCANTATVAFLMFSALIITFRIALPSSTLHCAMRRVAHQQASPSVCDA